MKRAGALALVANLAAAVAGGPAVASPPTLAILGVDGGGTSPELVAPLVSAIRRRVIRSGRFRLVPARNLDEIKLVFGCIDEAPACMARAGQTMGADKLLWGRLVRRRGGLYALKLVLLDVERARVDRRLSASITRGTLRRRPAVAAAAALRPLLGPLLGKLEVRAGVAGAEVLIDGQRVGRTGRGPLLIERVVPGKHQLEVRRPGREAWVKEVVVRPGRTVTAVVDLSAPAPEVMRPAAAASTDEVEEGGSGVPGWKIAFWSGAVVTVGLTVGVVVSGARVLGLQKDKEQAIRDAVVAGLGSARARRDLVNPDVDACAVAEGEPALGYLTDICDSGRGSATAFNVLLVAGIASALASGFFYYKGYIASPAAERPEGDQAGAARRVARRPRWRLLPEVNARGARLGLSVSF